MTSTVSADERAMRTIHTAACLIIGDEVLGGKVSLLQELELEKYLREHLTNTYLDGRYEFCMSSFSKLELGRDMCSKAYIRVHRLSWQSSASRWA